MLQEDTDDDDDDLRDRVTGIIRESLSDESSFCEVRDVISRVGKLQEIVIFYSGIITAPPLPSGTVPLRRDLSFALLHPKETRDELWTEVRGNEKHLLFGFCHYLLLFPDGHRHRGDPPRRRASSRRRRHGPWCGPGDCRNRRRHAPGRHRRRSGLGGAEKGSRGRGGGAVPQPAHVSRAHTYFPHFIANE